MGDVVVKRSRSLAEWVEHIQTLHHRQIDLTLDRVRLVYQRLAPKDLPFKVVSIAGTNGKGSTAEMLSSIYRVGGYRVGKYTSPHLVAFNERICIDGSPVSDDCLLSSFERVEQARVDVPITFFEFGTLVAIELFLQAGLDIAVMEVGLGGRMDAVNILDADLAIITNISIDHTAWLGNTVAKIAVEKAGIARAGKPCLLGTRYPPTSLISVCQKIGAETETIGVEFDRMNQELTQFAKGSNANSGWAYRSELGRISELPAPFAQSGVQLDNAALALRAVEKLQHDLPTTNHVLRRGLSDASIAGRCQIIQDKPLVVLDVSHNEASVERLQQFVNSHEFSGDLVVVCGMLKDKDIAKSFQHLIPDVSHWHLASIEGSRGSSSLELAAVLERCSVRMQVTCHEQVEAAYEVALKTLTADDCLLVFGSFYIVGDILALLNKTP